MLEPVQRIPRYRLLLAGVYVHVCVCVCVCVWGGGGGGGEGDGLGVSHDVQPTTNIE